MPDPTQASLEDQYVRELVLSPDWVRNQQKRAAAIILRLRHAVGSSIATPDPIEVVNDAVLSILAGASVWDRDEYPAFDDFFDRVMRRSINRQRDPFRREWERRKRIKARIPNEPVCHELEDAVALKQAATALYQTVIEKTKFRGKMLEYVRNFFAFAISGNSDQEIADRLNTTKGTIASFRRRIKTNPIVRRQLQIADEG
jgi:hypothetical protein